MRIVAQLFLEKIAMCVLCQRPCFAAAVFANTLGLISWRCVVQALCYTAVRVPAVQMLRI